MGAAASPRQQNEDTRTTLMLRNLPSDYNRELFLDMLDDECLAGEYDFVYFPVDFQTGSGLGYAFVNFTSHEEAVRAWQLLDGFKDWFVGSTKVCEARWSNPVQGLTANVQRYRNSPVMHDKVPDSYKPVVFSNGSGASSTGAGSSALGSSLTETNRPMTSLDLIMSSSISISALVILSPQVLRACSNILESILPSLS